MNSKIYISNRNRHWPRSILATSIPFSVRFFSSACVIVMRIFNHYTWIWFLVFIRISSFLGDIYFFHVLFSILFAVRFFSCACFRLLSISWHAAHQWGRRWEWEAFRFQKIKWNYGCLHRSSDIIIWINKIVFWRRKKYFPPFTM